MSKRKVLGVIVALIGTLLLTVAAILIFIFGSLSRAIADPPPVEHAIHFENLGQTIYVRARSWGLTGDHQEIVISESPILGYEIDVSRQIVYRGNSEIYYRKRGEILELHAGLLTQIPHGFSSTIKVQQIRLDYEKAAEYASNAEAMGLSRISVYPSR